MKIGGDACWTLSPPTKIEVSASAGLEVESLRTGLGLETTGLFWGWISQLQAQFRTSRQTLRFTFLPFSEVAVLSAVC